MNDWKMRLQRQGFVDNRPSWEKFSAKEWALALQSLTPSGSEFLTPAECVAFVRRSREFPPIIIRLREERESLRAALGSLLEQVFQMKDMFSDEDECIANAIADAQDALGVPEEDR